MLCLSWFSAHWCARAVSLDTQPHIMCSVALASGTLYVLADKRKRCAVIILTSVSSFEPCDLQHYKSIRRTKVIVLDWSSQRQTLVFALLALHFSALNGYVGIGLILMSTCLNPSYPPKFPPGSFGIEPCQTQRMGALWQAHKRYDNTWELKSSRFAHQSGRHAQHLLSGHSPFTARMHDNRKISVTTSLCRTTLSTYQDT